MRGTVLSLILFALTPSAGADAAWVEQYQVGSFEIRSEFRLRDIESLLIEIGELESDLETALRLKIEPSSIQLNLFANRRSYRSYMSRNVPEGVNRKALFVKSADQARVFAYRSLDFEVDVRHECTHALLHSALPFIPLWLDEGLAEYFEVEPRRRLAGSDHLKSLRWSTRLFWRPDLADLESHRQVARMGSDDYRESWAWVHFLLHESRESREVLISYLQAIEQGKPPGPLSRRLAAVMPDADRRLLEHLRTWGTN